MNYWIFVHKSPNVKRSFSQLLALKNYGFFSSKPIKSKIDALRKGDNVVFYLAGSEGGYFAGEAKLGMTCIEHKIWGIKLTQISL